MLRLYWTQITAHHKDVKAMVWPLKLPHVLHLKVSQSNPQEEIKMHYVIDVNKSISCQVGDKWLVLWSLLSTILIASFCSKMCFIITAVDHHLVDISALNLCMGRFCCNLLSIHCFFANFEKKQQQSFDIFLIQHPLLISHHQGPCLLLNLSYGQNNLEFANQVVHMPVLYWYHCQ